MTGDIPDTVRRLGGSLEAAAIFLLACLTLGATVVAALWLVLLPWRTGTAAGPLASAMADAILAAAPQLVAVFAAIPLIAKLAGLLARAATTDRSA